MIGASTALDGSVFQHIRPPKKNLNLSTSLDHEYPFPYDSDYFEASERVVFINPERASVNIIPKEGKSLDIKLFIEQEDRIRILQDRIFSFYGVNDSFDIPFHNFYRDPFFTYRIEYKETQEGTWKSTPERMVKTPIVSLDEKQIEVIFIGDDHIPDDADSPGNPLHDETLRNLRLSGEAINYFIKKILANPHFFPQDQESHLMNAFCMASTLYHIYLHESPDFIVDLGDHLGGFGHKWEGLGLKNQHTVTAQEMDAYEKMFRIATRKVFSALSPTIPIYWTLGNHDGEGGYLNTRVPATKYRKKYFKLPGAAEGGSPDENYYSLFWGAREGNSWLREGRKGGAQFIVLDCMRYNTSQPQSPKDWTIGNEQKEWLTQALKYDADWKFVLDHHVLGGWPSGSTEDNTNYSYGRGPLFNADDYTEFVKNPNLVEQVALTKLMGDNGVDLNVYGHDHIFTMNDIDVERTGKKMYGLCVGTPKYLGELGWYKGDYWKRFYGNYGQYGGKGEQSDFWGPSGYTKLTITKSSVRIDYIRSAINHPYTNIPESAALGDIVQSIII